MHSAALPEPRGLPAAGAATTRTHFIHHIDARLNRALYFTWWDRLNGTFADEHPQVVEKGDGIAEVWHAWPLLAGTLRLDW